MTSVISNQEFCEELQLPTLLKAMTVQEIKDYHRKKLDELSLKSLGQVPRLNNPSEEQKEWVRRKMEGSARSWEIWDQ